MSYVGICRTSIYDRSLLIFGLQISLPNAHCCLFLLTLNTSSLKRWGPEGLSYVPGSEITIANVAAQILVLLDASDVRIVPTAL
jgi:hypothetical protein